MEAFLTCIYLYSSIYNVDPQITKAIILVESNGNPNAVSLDRQDFGLMQVRRKYVPETRSQLLDPCTNIRRGTQILAEAMKRCKHKVDNTWTICFNLGITGGSRVKWPKKFPYYRKVVSKL